LVYRTGSDTSAPVTVNYTVVAPNPDYLGPAFFAGNVLPAGQVTIAAGQSSANLAINVAGALGNVPAAKLEVGISTDPAGPKVLAPTATVGFNNDHPVPGIAAIPAFLDPTGIGTLTHAGSSWTLDLGNVPAAAVAPRLVIDIANAASG